MKKRPKTFRRFLRNLLLGLLLIIGGTFALLHTPMLQDAISDFLSAKLSNEERTIALSGLRARWPFQVNLASVRISDPEGLWLETKDLSLHWHYRNHSFDVTTLNIDQVNLYRRPMPSETSRPASVFEPLPFGFDIPDANIQRLMIATPVIGKEIQGSLNAHATMAPDSTEITFGVKLNEDFFEIELQSGFELNQGLLKTIVSVAGDQNHQLDLVWQSPQLLIDVDSPDFPLLLDNIRPYLVSLPAAIAGLNYLPPAQSEKLPAKIQGDLSFLPDQLVAAFHMQLDSAQLQSEFAYHSAEKEFILSAAVEASQFEPICAYMKLPFAGVGTGTFSMRYQAGLQELQTDLRLSQVSMGTFSLGQTTASMALASEGYQIDLQTERKTDTDLQTLHSSVLLSTSNQGISIQAQEIEAKAGPFALSLSAPTLLSLQKGNIELATTQLTLNQLPFQTQLSWKDEILDLSVEVPELDIADFPHPERIAAKGTLSGALVIQGALSAPNARLNLAFNELEGSYGSFTPVINIKGGLTAAWSPTGLQLSANMEDKRENKVSATLTSTASWSLRPFAYEITTADIDAQVKGSIDLSLLNQFSFLGEQNINGDLRSDIQFQRQQGALNLTGNITLDEGRYEHYKLGTQLSKITVELHLHDQQIEITQASALTPGKGKINATGSWQLNSIPGHGELSINLNNARVLHLDPVQAALSGSLSLSRKEDRPFTLDGRLVLEDTLFDMDRLPKPVPAPLPFKIKGQEIVSVEAPKAKAQKTPQTPAPQIAGEIRLDIPGRLTVEGANLYSTWEGQFKIALKEGDVLLTGKLEPRRGTVHFFGRSFRLTDGTVHFNDEIGTIPILDLEAHYNRADIDAVLKITGPANQPRFRLSSNPPLPEDEILSQILFGKNMATITGLQALELGFALTSMMDSKGSDLDFMGKAKDFLSVDQLELRESGDAEGSTEIVAGRQINNRLYLEFNQSLKEPGSSLTLEYEIRRNLSITTETGTHILPGIGVNWKRDY
ncbi:translocation/assembly module TamB domain-containing protein [Kiritimatiellota bacterium B12222]|nr:translocation/assembly module TamB domain-containing protein [Kiritimatiellota bacterium B12222]